MPVRICFLFLLLLAIIPGNARAAYYRVRYGDNLTTIAQRYRLSVASLAHANGIWNPNFVEVGRLLFIPSSYIRPAVTRFRYHVQPGDSLLGLSARFGISVATIRALNPWLGPYPLIGQWLVLTRSAPQSSVAVQSQSSGSGLRYYRVRPGDTLSGIAVNNGVAVADLMTANHLLDSDYIIIGSVLRLPGGATYDPWAARSLIVAYAQRYGLEPSLPLAVGLEESGFNQNALSSTGAVGVMQVEPYTAATISTYWGRPVNLRLLDDNVHAGVYWLSLLVRYYGGDERMAVAAYYQGSRSLAKRGMFQDTVQYTANVMALKARFGG